MPKIGVHPTQRRQQILEKLVARAVRLPHRRIAPDIGPGVDHFLHRGNRLATRGHRERQPNDDTELRKCRTFANIVSHVHSRQLRQFANPQIFEFDRRPFGFEAQVAGARLAVVAAGHFFAVDPQPHFAVDAADVVVVPLADALAEILAGKLRTVR